MGFSVFLWNRSGFTGIKNKVPIAASPGHTTFKSSTFAKLHDEKSCSYTLRRAISFYFPLKKAGKGVLRHCKSTKHKAWKLSAALQNRSMVGAKK